jgi:hypothetical protein
MDNTLLQEILLLLKSHYPNDVYFPDHKDLENRLQTQEFQSSLYYLAEHGLIELKNIRRGHPFIGQVLGAKLNAKGIDYLLPDGGLTEYFNTVTVRFDAEDMRKLISVHIDALDIDKDKKHKILSNLKSFSVDTLREIAKQAILEGLKNPTSVIQLIESLKG